jgi:hypothetical protein
MDVGVDHAGHHGGGAEVEHARAGRDGDRAAHIGDAVALDEHDLIGEHGAGLGVEQSPGPDGDKLVGRRQVFLLDAGISGGAAFLRPHRTVCGANHCGDETYSQFALPTHEVLPYGEQPYFVSFGAPSERRTSPIPGHFRVCLK